MKEEQIIQLLEGLFEGEELNDCFVTELNISGNKIMVFVDSDTEMGFDRCRKISRFLEGHFDDTQAFGEKYTLEVSSPGVGRPLRFKRQYKKNLGRKVEATLKDEKKKVKGELTAVTETGIAVSYMVKEKVGKKNVKKNIIQEISDDEIETLIVKVSF